MAEVKKATLYWPNWQKTEVVVGSKQASDLQSKWWWLTPWSYKEPASVTAQNTVTDLNAGVQEIIQKYWLDEASGAALNYLARDVAANKSTVWSPEQAEKALQTAIQEASVDLEPYYQEKTAEELEDYKASLANLRNEALRYKQQEEKSYAQTLQRTKDNLRQRGLTFSGMNRKALWAEWSMNNLWLEWDVPMQRRYNLEDARANFQQRANTVWLEAERRLGSSALWTVNAWNIPDPYWAYQGWTGITYDPSRMQPIYLPKKQWQTGYRSIGDLEKEKMTALENAAQSRFSRQLQYLQ